MQSVVEMRSIGVSDPVSIGQLTSIIDFVPSHSLSIVLEGLDRVRVGGSKERVAPAKWRISISKCFWSGSACPGGYVGSLMATTIYDANMRCLCSSINVHSI